MRLCGTSFGTLCFRRDAGRRRRASEPVPGEPIFKVRLWIGVLGNIRDEFGTGRRRVRSEPFCEASAWNNGFASPDVSCKAAFNGLRCGGRLAPAAEETQKPGHRARAFGTRVRDARILDDRAEFLREEPCPRLVLPVRNGAGT